MSDERRLERLEEKVDGVKDQVSELKSDLKIHSSQVADKLDIFEQHIIGDNKIIDHIQPLLENLPAIREAVDEFKFEKRLRERKKEKRKRITWVLGSASLLVGILAGVIRLI